MKIKLFLLGKLVLFTQIIIILIILYASTQIYSPGLKDLESLKKNTHQIHTIILESEYPIRVLNNVSNLPEDRKQNQSILDTYELRKSEVESNFQTIHALFGASRDLLTKYDYYLWFQNKTLRGEMESLALQLETLRNIIPNSIAHFTIHSDARPHVNLIDAQTEANLAISDIEAQLNYVVDTFISTSQSYFTAFFYVIFLFSIIQTIIILRVLNFEKKFIKNIIKKLRNDNLFSKMEDAELPRQVPNPIFEEELEILNDTHEFFKMQRFIDSIEESLQIEYDMDHLLDTLFNKAQKVLSYDRIGIAFVDYKNMTIRAEHGVANYDNILLGPGFEVSISETSLSHTLENKKSFITPDLMRDHRKNQNSPSLSLITQEGIRSNLVVPILINDKVYGFTFFSSKEKNHYDQNDISTAENITQRLSSSLLKSYMIKVLFNQMISSFSSLVDNKDFETGDHLYRMSQYSKILTNTLFKMNLSTHTMDKNFVQDMEVYSRSHDIGKIGIPDKILKKPGKLTKEEFEIIKSHPVIGGDVFDEIKNSLSLFEGDYFKIAHDIARYHHEKWDGSGYPEGLKGHDIPLSARIVAVADVFDALCSKRVYKDAISFSDAVDIILKGKGKHFDPTIIDAFLISLDELIAVSENGNQTLQPHAGEEVQ